MNILDVIRVGGCSGGLRSQQETTGSAGCRSVCSLLCRLFQIQQFEIIHIAAITVIIIVAVNKKYG